MICCESVMDIALLYLKNEAKIYSKFNKILTKL